MSATPKPPEQPKFNPINIPDVLAQALQADIGAYNTSDADFLARFPGLVATRDSEISDAYKQLTGPLDPTVQGSFVDQGIIRAIKSTGGGNAMAGVQQGSLSGNTAAASIANSTMAKQDYDRQYFDALVNANPQRAFGLSGSDVANLSIANTGTLNANNAVGYQNQIAGIQAAGAAGVQTGAAIAGIGGAFASLGGTLSKSDKDLKTNITDIGTCNDIPMVTFNYKGIPDKKYVGVLAQSVKDAFPDAVINDARGFLLVDYSILGIDFREIDN